MGEFFQCDTGEILPLHNYLKSEKKCIINGLINNSTLTILKVLWMKEPLE